MSVKTEPFNASTVVHKHNTTASEVEVGGKHSTEGVAGVEVKTSGKVTASFTRQSDGSGSVSSISFDDVMAAKPVSGSSAQGSDAVKVTANAEASLKGKVRAQAAVTATGRAVETGNSGEVKKS